MGKRPIETVEAGKKIRKETTKKVRQLAD